MVKKPPAIQEMWVLSLGEEDPLEEEMATHSSLLAWRIPWTEEPGGNGCLWGEVRGRERGGSLIAQELCDLGQGPNLSEPQFPPLYNGVSPVAQW